jgi:hypothetical protein
MLAPEPEEHPTPNTPLKINDPVTGNIAAGSNRPTRLQFAFDMDFSPPTQPTQLRVQPTKLSDQ